MEYLFTVDSLISLVTLTVLEIVLGIDNVIFVSILIGRLDEVKQKLNARRIWMIAGIAVRIGLLGALSWLVANGSRELFGFTFYEKHYPFNLRNCIMFAGGLFLLYKTVKEIHHKLEGEEDTLNVKKNSSAFSIIVTQIILVDTVFSFDSIITAIGLAKHVEMLALAFLLMIGFSLFFEGLEPLHHSYIDKSYIYVAMAFSFAVELLNIRMRRKQKERQVVKLRGPKVPEKR